MTGRCVTFDLWKTLLVDTAEPERSAARVEGLEAILAAAGHRIAGAAIAGALERTAIGLWRRQAHDQRDRGPLGHADDFLQHLGLDAQPNGAGYGLASLRASVAHEIATTILRYPPSLIDGAEEAVRLAAGRAPVALISNTGFSPGSSLRRILDELGLGGCFRVWAFSDEVGWAKPHAAIFARAVEGLGAEPANVLHVGDTFDADVVGAHRAGMRTAWIASNAGAGEAVPMPGCADATVSTLRDTLPVLDRWLTRGTI